MKNTAALTEYLTPIWHWLQDAQVSELSINQPGEIFIERGNATTRQAAPSLTAYWLEGLATLVGQFSDQRVDPQTPLLSASLPDGHRLQFVLPPACASPALSIRKQVVKALSLDAYETQGAFSQTVLTRPFWAPRAPSSSAESTLLTALLQKRQYAAFLKTAVHLKKNILISGSTSSGKTTFLNACLAEVPLNERIITLEDVREIQLPHLNKLHLLVSKGEQGPANVGLPQLIEASLRLRPDRLVLGELRGAEAADFINATATGHDGALSTLHAPSPAMAFARLVHLVKLKPGMNLGRDDILHDLHSLVDIVVQLKRAPGDPAKPAQRIVSELYWAGAPPALFT